MSSTREIVSAFTAEQVERLTGLTRAQLNYWDRIGFFKPHYGAENRRSPYSRIYSFKDVVGLRTIAVLKSRHGVSLKHLREVAKGLEEYSDAPWADIRLKVWNRQVQFDEPETGKTRGGVDRQYVLLPIIDVIGEVTRAAKDLRSRDPSTVGKIEQNRLVSHNAPVIAGTRIPVATIRRFAEDGYTPAQIVAEYPRITEADVKAALRYDGTNKAA